jgi:hypothetical protein
MTYSLAVVLQILPGCLPRQIAYIDLPTHHGFHARDAVIEHRRRVEHRRVHDVGRDDRVMMML